MRATGDSITAGRSFRKPKIRGIFRFREKPGCPFQARLFALVPAGLALRPPSRPPLADAQEGESRATQPERSHAGATTSATRETPLRRLAYPRTPARLRPATTQEGAAFGTPFAAWLIPKGWPGLRPANGLNSRPYPPCRHARAAPVARGKPASRNARACGQVSHRCAPWIRADGMSRARERPRLAGAARSPKGEDSGRAGRTLDVTGAERASRRGSRGKVLTPAPRRLAGESGAWGSAPSQCFNTKTRVSRPG